jgi:hypothetical protein
LNYLLIKVLSVNNLTFLFEDLTHVVIAAAQIYALRTIELRF